MGGALFVTGDADGPAVVLDDEYDRGLVDAGKIEGFVEVAFGGGTVAADANGYNGVTGDLAAIARPTAWSIWVPMTIWMGRQWVSAGQFWEVKPRKA